MTDVGDVTGTGDSNANGAMSISLALSNVTTAGNVGNNIDATARSFTVPYFTLLHAILQTALERNLKSRMF